MPISGPSSYLPVTDSFLAHWASCNATLGAAGPLLLSDGEAVADLQALRATLAAQRTAVESERNGREFARANIEIRKAALLERLNQFNTTIRSLDSTGLWTNLLPKAFGQGDAPGKVEDALDDIADAWDRYEAAESAVTLPGGYELPAFQTDLAALKAAFTAYSSEDNGLKLARSRRNLTQDAIYPILKKYRVRVEAVFGEDSAETASLPRLTPLPGHTPPPAVLEAVYNPATEQADVVITQPDDEAATEVELLATVGPEFEEDDATSLGVFPRGDGSPIAVSTALGMALPLGAVSLRAVVRTAEGNERSSNVVTVTRPAA